MTSLVSIIWIVEAASSKKLAGTGSAAEKMLGELKYMVRIDPRTQDITPLQLWLSRPIQESSNHLCFCVSCVHTGWLRFVKSGQEDPLMREAVEVRHIYFLTRAKGVTHHHSHNQGQEISTFDCPYILPLTRSWSTQSTREIPYSFKP